MENEQCDPYVKLCSVRLAKDMMDTNYQLVINYIKDFIYKYILNIALFNKKSKRDDRGKSFFGKYQSKHLKSMGKSIVQISLECVYMWATWYPNDELLQPTFMKLKNDEKVVFPKKLLYFNSADALERIPIEYIPNQYQIKKAVQITQDFVREKVEEFDDLKETLYNLIEKENELDCDEDKMFILIEKLKQSLESIDEYMKIVKHLYDEKFRDQLKGILLQERDIFQTILEDYNLWNNRKDLNYKEFRRKHINIKSYCKKHKKNWIIIQGEKIHKQIQSEKQKENQQNFGLEEGFNEKDSEIENSNLLVEREIHKELIINRLFSSMENYKLNHKQYIEMIENNQQLQMRLLMDIVQETFEQQYLSPLKSILCLKFLKDSISTKNLRWKQKIIQKALSHVGEIA